MSRFAISWRVLGALALTASLAAGGVALGATSTSRRHRRSGLSLERVLADQSKSPMHVIVLLRNQHANLPPSAVHATARSAALLGDQRPVEAAVRSAGGRITVSYRVINGFAAVVSGAERTRLAGNPAVAAVLPDAVVHAPGPSSGQGERIDPKAPDVGAHSAGVKASTGVTSGGQAVCPSNPSQPLLEPEALSLINAEQANQLATGAGVKVAFIADGLDPDNPNFIRPNGSHVFVDYRDFSGFGLGAPTGGEEAFGDASSIAAQGTVVYDLSKFVNPAHPLPAGCNIIVKGVAPGASLVGMNVFGSSNNAFTSTIIQGMDWAVAQDHVNVLNESFGSDQIPDTDQDAIKQFNRLAVAAGVTVTVSSGDQGTANTIGSPASDPSAIDVGATTQFQHFAQTERGGFQLGLGGWVNNNIAEFSSGGFTQGGRTVDLVAPGNENYVSCDANTTLYADCTNFAGQPSNVRSFGGTSESSPLTAGVAALVIQAYRQAHNGSSPSPALVKQLITSNAQDLNIPSDEQGAGELDALAAVQAARSYHSKTPTGNGRLVSPGQLDLSAPAGSGAGGAVTVTNLGASSDTIASHLRTITTQLSNKSGTVTLNTGTDPQFTDQLGVPQAYQEFKFTVPAGADRLDGSIAWPEGAATVNMTLFDPAGRFTAFTYTPPGGGEDFGHIDVRNPPAGQWTAAVFTEADSSGFNGAVNYDLSTSKFGPVGNVTPSSVNLAPGASATLHVSLGAPAAPGDYSRDLVLSGSSGRTTVVPVVMRSLISLASGHGSFAGTITGGDGDGVVAREDTYGFRVPPGAPGINVQWNMPNDPNTPISGFLVNPDGQSVGNQIATQPASGPEAMQLFVRRPEPGQWKLVIETQNPVGGSTVAGPFSGTISLQAPSVRGFGVPDSRRAAIRRGRAVTATIVVSNPGDEGINAFVDPRREARTNYLLLPVTQATNVGLPLSAAALPPIWVVPTETSTLYAAAQASAPITFDWGFNDPDLLAQSSGDNAFSAFSEQQVTPAEWFVTPALLGPFATQKTGTVNTGMVAYARTFDPSVASSTGDPQLADVDSSPPPTSPFVIAPGASAAIGVRITASGRRGQVVAGDLFVDDLVVGPEGPVGEENELAAIPYEYRIG